MKSSCNQLQHLTNTIPSPFARLNKHPDLLQASEISWHMAHLCRKDFQRTTPWKQKVKKTCLVCPDSFQSNKHDKLQDYHLQILRFIKLVNGSTEQTAETNITKSQGTPPPPSSNSTRFEVLGSFSTTQFSLQKHLFSHIATSLSSLLRQCNKTTFGLRIAWDQSAKIAKVRELLWRFYRAIVTWCYIRARSAVHQVALQTLGGRKGKVHKVLFQIRRWTDTTQKGSWSTYSKLHMILGMSWGDIETKWTNWFLQNSICAKGQAPCYATKPTNYNYSPKKPSKTVGISQSLPKKAKVRTSQDPFITSNVITGQDALSNFNPERGPWWPKWWKRDTWGIGEAADNDDNLGKSHGHMAPKPQQADALDKWGRWCKCHQRNAQRLLLRRPQHELARWPKRLQLHLSVWNEHIERRYLQSPSPSDWPSVCQQGDHHVESSNLSDREQDQG